MQSKFRRSYFCICIQLPIAKIFLLKCISAESTSRSADRLLNNDEYSDMKISIGETEIPAHSSVLCLQSEYFKNGVRLSKIRKGRVRVWNSSLAAYSIPKYNELRA